MDGKTALPNGGGKFPQALRPLPFNKVDNLLPPNFTAIAPSDPSGKAPAYRPRMRCALAPFYYEY